MFAHYKRIAISRIALVKSSLNIALNIAEKYRVCTVTKQIENVEISLKKISFEMKTFRRKADSNVT